MLRARIALLTVMLALMIAELEAQPAHLAVVGDPAASLPLAQGWSPASIERDDEGLIKAAPFWSSHWQDAGLLRTDAKVPAPPSRLLKQEPGRVLGWGKREHKLKPVIIATEHAVLVLAMPRQSRRSLSPEELEWLQPHFSKKLKSKLAPEQVAHLYGLRYLRLEAMWKDLLGLSPNRDGYRSPGFGDTHFGSKGRSELYVFAKSTPYGEFGRHFFGGAGDQASYWWHKDTETIIGAFHAEALKPGDVNGRFHHLVAHNLVYQYRCFYHYLPTWVAHGVAHYFARRSGKAKNTYIIIGGADKKHEKGWRWDAKGTKSNWWGEAKSLVKSGKARKMAELGLQTQDQQLHPRYHVQGWSMVHYIIGMGKGRFRTFLDEMMRKGEDESILQVQQRALLRGCGVNMVQFDRHWREWVSRSTPPKK